MPRSARLLTGGDFQRVLGARQVESDRYFRIHWGVQPRAGTGPRLGLAIAKRIARRAVDRNRLRRIARESFRLRRNRLPALDFVVMAKASALGADRAELRRSLNQLWLRFESQ